MGIDLRGNCQFFSILHDSSDHIIDITPIVFLIPTDAEMSQRMYRIGTMVRMNKFNKMTKPVQHAIQNWNIVAGDKVQVIEGRDAGKYGIVERVLRHRNLIFVSGLKKGLRYTKPSEYVQ